MLADIDVESEPEVEELTVDDTKIGVKQYIGRAKRRIQYLILRGKGFEDEYEAHRRIVKIPLSRNKYSMLRVEWEFALHESPWSPDTQRRLSELAESLGF